MLLDDILPHILVDAPGCPSPVARRALLNAAIEFCDFTHAWNEIQDPITLIDNQHTYDVDLPTGAAVALVMSIAKPSGEIHPRTMDQVKAWLPDWQTASSTSPTVFASPSSKSQVRLFPTPKDAQRLRVTMRVAYKPTITATELPDDLVNDHLEALVHGALTRLMAEPGKAWSNPGLVGYHRDQFELAKNNTRADQLSENVSSETRIEPARPFGL